MTTQAPSLPVVWPTTASRWWLAVSGGLDSMCLLHLVHQLQQANASLPPVHVVHVHHGLQTDADQWQQQVLDQCLQYAFDCHVQRVQITPSDISTHGVEGAARHARYECFAKLLIDGDVLLLGQHADDQAETLLLRLLRGAGVAGLGAMPQQRDLGAGQLFRPMLGVTKQALEGYADHYGLQWSEDPSNADQRYERNFLRQRILPPLKRRWPSALERLQTTALIMQESQSLLHEVGLQDMLVCQTAVGGEQGLDVATLLSLSQARRNNVLRTWLQTHDVDALSYAGLQRLEQEVLRASVGAQPHMAVRAGVVYRSYGMLCWRPDGELTRPNDIPAELIWCTDKQQSQAVPFAGGVLVPADRGMQLLPGDVLRAQRRVGGERCQPVGRRHSQSLKKLLQEYRVPTWQRQQLPLFYRNDELAMVADLWVNHGFESSSVKGWRWQCDAGRANAK